jgi:CRP-like cAMP-binding protein
VEKITWRHTAVETRNGEVVVIPNGWLMKNRFTVVGPRADGGKPWRRWIRVNVEATATPSRVCAVMESAVRDARISHVAEHPAPSAVLLEIGPRYGGYALRYWLEEPEADDATDSAVRIHLLAALARNAMKIGAPYNEQLEIKDNEAHREAARIAERERRVAALSGVDLFAPLSAAEREALAGDLAFAPFIAGDIITCQGATAHWLYLVVSGEADVWIDTPHGRKPIATLGPGQVFGEMGMMTGAPRSATVGARTDVICYRLDKEGFQSIINARPDVAQAMSVVLADRQTDLRGRDDGRESPAPQHHAAILERIRDFFGLQKREEASSSRDFTRA